MELRWQTVKPQRTRIVMWGAGDQGRVNGPILAALGCQLVALVDDTSDLPSPFPGGPIFHGWSELERWLAGEDISTLGFVVAIGNPFGHIRRAIHQKLSARGLLPISIVDPSAQICRSARIGVGLQVMAQAIIHNEAIVGAQCIVNTRSLVEHDCVLEDGVEIGPAATLCGRVHVGENTWIGAGATVRPRIRIGKNVIVGIGAAVVADVPDGVMISGVPARRMVGKETPSARAALGEGLR